MKTIPKSLHTVTVLVAVARLDMAARNSDAHSAVHEALHVLGYANSPDIYGLAAKARAILAREVAA